MNRHCFFITNQQEDNLRQLSDQSGLPAAELVRRILDRSFADTVLNEIVPTLSGYLSVKVK